jgi:hypothetical protein
MLVHVPVGVVVVNLGPSANAVMRESVLYHGGLQTSVLYVVEIASLA